MANGGGRSVGIVRLRTKATEESSNNPTIHRTECISFVVMYKLLPSPVSFLTSTLCHNKIFFFCSLPFGVFDPSFPCYRVHFHFIFINYSPILPSHFDVHHNFSLFFYFVHDLVLRSNVFHFPLSLFRLRQVSVQVQALLLDCFVT